jgi:hypothetical protein
MGTIELKSNIHKILDEIQSEQLLQTLYDFLKTKETNKPGQLWNSLSDIEKKEVLQAYDESESDENLSEMNSLFKKSE